jgi:hypothetical protein
VEVSGEGAKRLHGFGIAIRRDRDDVRRGAAVDTGGVGMDLTKRAACTAGVPRRALVWHSRLLYTKEASGNREGG